MIKLEDLDICREYQYLSNNIIKIYNPKTGHFTLTRSVFDIPEGYYIVKRRPFTLEARKKMSEKAKQRGTPKCAHINRQGENNPMFGKRHTKESKEKISQSMKKLNQKKKQLTDNPTD